MSKTEAIALIEKSVNELRETAQAIHQGNMPKAKRHFAKALSKLDNTCAIQLDTLK